MLSLSGQGTAVTVLLINVSLCSNFFHYMKLEKFLNKVNVGNLQMCDIQKAVGRPDSI